MQELAAQVLRRGILCENCEQNRSSHRATGLVPKNGLYDERVQTRAEAFMYKSKACGLKLKRQPWWLR